MNSRGRQRVANIEIATSAPPVSIVIAPSSSLRYIWAPACCRLSSVEGAGWPNTLTPSRATYTESVIYNFAGGSEGALPLSALTAGSKGDEVQRRQLGVYGRLRHGVRADPGARAAHTRIA
jgi:hypothetical protein